MAKLVEKLKVGDVVVLISGGPKMTIDSLFDGNNRAKCAWFRDGMPEVADFDTRSLKLV